MLDSELWGTVITALTDTQTFTVTAEDADAVIPQDDDRDFSADVSGADEVSIALVEVDDVTIENGTISFDELVDEDGDFTVDFYTGDDVEIANVTVDGVIIGGSGSQFDGLEGDELVFTLSGTDSLPVDVHAIVFVADDANALATDADGLPTADFGAGEATFFNDVDALSSSPMGMVNRAEGSTFTVEVSLENVQLGAGDEFTVPADGQTVRLRASDTVAENTYAGVNVDTAVALATGTTEDGVVSFEVDASDAETGDTWWLSFQWTGSGPYATQSIVLDSGSGGVVVTFIDEEPDVDLAQIAVDTTFSAVAAGSNQTVTATVVDQFGQPFPGVSVLFNEVVGGAFTGQTRTTDADGEVSLTYQTSAAASTDPDDHDVILVDVLDEDDIPTDSFDFALVWRFVAADEDSVVSGGLVPAAAPAANAIFAFGDDGAGTDALFAFDLNDGPDRSYVVPYLADTRANFNTYVSNQLDADNLPFAQWVTEGSPDELQLTVAGYGNDAALTVFTITPLVPASVVATAANADLAAGAGQENEVTAVVTSAGGQSLIGIDVTFTIDAGGGALSALTVATDSNGEAVTTYTTVANDNGTTVDITATATEPDTASFTVAAVQLTGATATAADLTTWGADGDVLVLTFDAAVDPAAGQTVTVNNAGGVDEVLTLDDTAGAANQVLFAVSADGLTVTLTATVTTGSQGDFSADTTVTATTIADAGNSVAEVDGAGVTVN